MPAVRIAEGLHVHPDAEALRQTADDEAGRHAVGEQRQTAEGQERQVGVAQARGYAEGHGLGYRQLVVAQQRGDDAALAVGALPVIEGDLDIAGQGHSVHGCSGSGSSSAAMAQCVRVARADGAGKSLECAGPQVPAHPPLEVAGALGEQHHVHALAEHVVFQRRVAPALARGQASAAWRWYSAMAWSSTISSASQPLQGAGT